MLTSSKQLILNAQRGKYAVGSFNTSDLEITQAIIWAAEKLVSPVIVETSERAIAFAGLEEIAAIIKEKAAKSKVPVVLHLDHGKSLEMVQRCLREGYTSVMFDGSELSYEENIILTRRAVEMAHRKKATCEGELGSIGKKDTKGQFTNPEEVAEFVKRTQVDMLAVSFGSSHGIGRHEKLDIDLLKKIKSKTKVPLVLHGASGVGEKDIKDAIANGICKINIDTDIRHTFSQTIRKIGKEANSLNSDPREIMSKVVQAIQSVVEEKIKMFGSEGKVDKV